MATTDGSLKYRYWAVDQTISSISIYPASILDFSHSAAQDHIKAIGKIQRLD